MKLGSRLAMAMAVLSACAGPLLAAGLAQQVEMSGAAAIPSNASTGTGLAQLTHDPDAHTLRVEIAFSGLLGNAVGAHIHCCVGADSNGPVASSTPTFPGFPAGVTSGSYDATVQLTQTNSYSAAFLAGNAGSVAQAEQALVSAMAQGRAYVDVHTTVFPGGELRGQLPRITPVFGDGFEGQARDAVAAAAW